MNCYVEANHTEYGKKTLGYIYYVIKDCILREDANAKIVFIGDFN